MAKSTEIRKVVIGIGSDHWGFDLKHKLLQFLVNRDIAVVDFGTYSTDPVDYPDIAIDVAESILSGMVTQGILICRTGLGMAIAANKVPEIFATPVWNPTVARLARQSNNANVITIGAEFIDFDQASNICLSWLQANFKGGGSALKVDKILHFEERYTQNNHFPEISGE